jgi:hypothetical protein
MTRPPSKTPIESFGSELFTALIEGSKRKIEIQTTYRTAVKIRLRVHQLRARMREESHPLYSVAARTRVTISWANTIEVTSHTKAKFPKDLNAPVTLTFAPQDSEYGDIFKKAGVTVVPVDPKLFSESLEPPNGDSPPTLEDLLKDFK